MATLDQLTDQHTKLVEQHGFELKVDAHPNRETKYNLTRENPKSVGNWIFPERISYHFDIGDQEFKIAIDVNMSDLMSNATPCTELSETKDYLDQFLDLDRELSRNGPQSTQGYDGANAFLIYSIPARNETETARLGMFLKRLDDYLTKM
tara:strand:- start:996 stop:1445 length:450 start_codon:yes stop_codon:yes gene_type:complete